MSPVTQFRTVSLKVFIKSYRSLYGRAPCGVYVLFLADGTALYVGETIGGREFRLSRHLGNPRSDVVCDRLLMPNDIAWFDFYTLPAGSTKTDVTALECAVAQRFENLLNVKTLQAGTAALPIPQRHYLMEPTHLATEATIEAQIRIADERVTDIQRWLIQKPTRGVKRGLAVWQARLDALRGQLAHEVDAAIAATWAA